MASDGARQERSRLFGQFTNFTFNLSKSALGALATRVGGLTLKMSSTFILNQAQLRLLSTEQRAWMARAGAAIRDARETAGMSRDDLARALDIEDKTVLKAMEQGTATVSFELILRLTSLLARNDPIPFLINLVRGFNPRLWALLEDWGIGRLPSLVERDRKWMNIYRGNDAARRLSDEEFDRVLAFCSSALDLAMQFNASDASSGPREASKNPDPDRDDRHY